MELFRIEVGHQHGVEPRNIVGAIANEAGLDAEHIGHIDIGDEFSKVELPTGMPKSVFKDLKKVWVCGKQLNISRIKTAGAASDGKPKKHQKGKVSKHQLASDKPGKRVKKDRS